MSGGDAIEPSFTGDPLKDRLLERSGAVTAEQIEQYRFTAEEEAARRNARDELVRRVFGGLRALPGGESR